MADIIINPGSSLMSFTSSLNYTQTITQDVSGSLILQGSGSTGRTDLFTVNGNNGTLFSVSDDLSDSLFSVNTIAGLPVIEAFANNTVTLGQYGQNVLVVTGSRVGIGTSAPAYKLDITAASTSDGLRISQGGAARFVIFGDGVAYWGPTANLGVLTWDTGKAIIMGQSGAALSLGSNGSWDRLFINTSGNVGIGTTSISYKLDVAGTLRSTSDTVLANASNSVIKNSNNYLVVEGQNSSAQIGFYRSGTSDITYIGADSSYLFRLWDENFSASYFNILQDGKVGIGTTNPGYNLEVNGWVGASRYYPYNTNSTYIDGDGSGLRITGTGYLYVPAAGGSYFEGSVRMRGTISNDNGAYLQINGGTSNITYFNGTVGIGTTNPDGYKLRVNGTSLFEGEQSIYYTNATQTMVGGSGYSLFRMYGNSNGVEVQLDANAHNGTAGTVGTFSNSDFFIKSNNTNRMVIKSDGKIGIGTTSPVAGFDNQQSSGIYRQRGLTTMVTNALGADGTQAKRYEIARATIDYNDWNDTGPIEIELYETYYSDGCKKKYSLSYGWQASGQATLRLTQMDGYGTNNFQVSVGSPVTISGDSRYIPIYVDVRYYSYVVAVLKTSRALTTSNPPGNGGIYLNNNPSGTNISDFTADSTVIAGNANGGYTAFIAGNVGIGTTSPSYPLHVYTGDSSANVIGVTNGTQTLTLGVNNSSGGSFLFENGNNALRFGTNGAERMRITNAGNVGIGTDTPAAETNYKALTLDATSGTFTEYRQGSTNIFRVGADGSRPFLYGATNAPMDFFTNTTLKMRIATDGNVGIGTTDAAGQMSGTVGLAISHTNYPAVGFRNSTTSWLWYGVGSNLRMWNASYGDILTATTDGRIGIGTDSPSVKFQINAGSSDGIILRTTSNAEPFIALQRNSANSGVGVFRLESGGILYFDNGSNGAAQSTKMTILGGGNVGIGTTNPQTKLEVYGGHEDTKFRLYSTGNGSSTDSSLDMWASEPGVTYDGAGIGTNVNGHPYYGRRNTGLAQSYIRFYSGDVLFNTGTTTAAQTAVIKSSGRVGIGTGSPSTILHLYGTTTTMTITDTSYGRTSQIGYTDNANLYFANDSNSNTYIGAYNDLYLAYGGGDVGIGTTAASYKLDVNGSTRVVGSIIGQNSSNTTRYEFAPDLAYTQVGVAAGLGSHKPNSGVASLTSMLRLTSTSTYGWLQGSQRYFNGTVISDGLCAETISTAGTLLFLNSNSEWGIADADVVGKSNGLLGIALNTTSGIGETVHVLIDGIISLYSNHDQLTSPATPGAPLYVSTTAGSVTEVAPSGTGDVVRLVGHNLSAISSGNDIAVIRFQPDATWIEL